MFKGRFSSASHLTQLAFVALLSSMLTGWAATFPLPIPTRPTSFPLQRPAITGTVVAWGPIVGGQTPVPAGNNFVAIAASGNVTTALRSDGTVSSWGLDNKDRPVPAGLTNVVAIAEGNSHTVALKSDGTVVAWNLGSLPNVPNGLSGVVAIAAGNRFTLALKKNGTVIGWGGEGPVNVPVGLVDVVAISSYIGSYNSVALKQDGTVIAWNAYPPSGIDQPNAAAGLTDVVAISAGLAHTLALKRDGTVVAWGKVLYFDQITGGGVVDATVPIDLSGVIAIAAGAEHSLALKADRTVVAWGGNSRGQLNVPHLLSDVVAILASNGYSVALQSEGVTEPRQAKAEAVIVGGKLAGISVSESGGGYPVPPFVIISGGGGIGATAVATMFEGFVTGFSIVNPGSGYTSSPLVLIASPPFAPEVAIEVSRVNVKLKVVLGRKYQLQASKDLKVWTVTGPVFVAEAESLTQEFVVAEVGSYFRLVEVP